MTLKRNIYWTFLGTTCASLIATVTAFFIYYALGKLNKVYLVIAYLSVALLEVAIITTCIALLINHYTIIRNLREENGYNLNRKNGFYNQALFSKTLAKNWKKLTRKEGYLINLSPVKKGSYSYSGSHKTLSSFYGYISDFFYKYFTKNDKIDPKCSNYCFSHTVFLIYITCDAETLNTVLGDLENEIYSIVQREDIRIFVQPSFGVCKNTDGKTIYQIINRADVARRIAETNFETVVFYNSEMTKRKESFSADEIMRGLKEGEFVVYYQPKYHLQTKQFVSLEALIRWDSPKYGLLTPFQFISFAESGGLIHNLDMFVFEQVCKDLVDCKKRGRRALPCSINFSLYEFYSPGFVDDVISTIKRYEINPALIEIEITEGTSSANTFLAISILRKFKDYGMKILMDDFGVGYSNLSSLKKMPIDVVKIDKSFIDDIVLDTRSREVVKFLIAFCKANNLEVVAEGVDDAKQIEILKKAKCDMIQGYYYSKPIPLKELERFKSSNPFEKKEYL